MQVNNSKAKQIAKWTNWLFTDHRLVDKNHNFLEIKLSRQQQVFIEPRKQNLVVHQLLPLTTLIDQFLPLTTLIPSTFTIKLWSRQYFLQLFS